jgi:hypothetical protein
MTAEQFGQEDTTDGLGSLSERLDGIRRMAQSCNNLGIVYRKMGQADGAIEMHGKSLGMHKRAGDVRGMVRAYTIAWAWSTRTRASGIEPGTTTRRPWRCLSRWPTTAA